MKNKDFNELLKKCFGKEKDDRYHAIAMLAIYGIFIVVVVLVIRLGGSSTNNNLSTNPTPTPTPVVTPSPTNDSTDNDEDENITGNDINYSYSYTISYNGISEVYLGKKLDDKEKFTLIKDGVTTDYAILSDNYLKLENGVYHITESPSRLFKYCDVNEILAMIENSVSTENGNTISYYISNQDLADTFNDNLAIDNNQNNTITLTLSNGNLKNIDLNFSNYLSSVNGLDETLTIHMEFVDVGTTEDFEIKVS